MVSQNGLDSSAYFPHGKILSKLLSRFSDILGLRKKFETFQIPVVQDFLRHQYLRSFRKHQFQKFSKIF
jgi:hypothetical protein